MRKIEQQMNDAIRNRARYWGKDNTRVEWNSIVEGSNGTKHIAKSDVFLHGNHIATVYQDTGEIKVNLYTLRKWPSMTTRSRLRALGADLVSIKGVLHLNGKSIYSEAE